MIKEPGPAHRCTCPFLVESCRSIVSGFVFPTVGSPLNATIKHVELVMKLNKQGPQVFKTIYSISKHVLTSSDQGNEWRYC